jgi:hypothetical protein
LAGCKIKKVKKNILIWSFGADHPSEVALLNNIFSKQNQTQ